MKPEVIEYEAKRALAKYYRTLNPTRSGLEEEHAILDMLMDFGYHVEAERPGSTAVLHCECGRQHVLTTTIP